MERFIFNQQVNMEDFVTQKEISVICVNHPECKECPLKNGQVYKNYVCETGRVKGEDNK